MLKRVDDFLSSVEEKILVFLSAIALVVFTVQIINRLFIGIPMAWTDEVSRFDLVWIVCISAAYGMKKGFHIGVDAFVNMLPAKASRVIRFVTLLACLAFAFSLTIAAWKLCALQFKHPQLTPILSLPMLYNYIVMLIGALLMDFHIFANIVYYFKNETAVN